MNNYNSYDSDYYLAHITGNMSPPLLRRQNAFSIRNRENDSSYSSNYPLNEFTDFAEEIFFLEQEISNENQQEIEINIDTEINIDEIINRSIPDEINTKIPPILRKIQSEYKESITIKSFNAPPPLTKFYSF